MKSEPNCIRRFSLPRAQLLKGKLVRLNHSHAMVRGQRPGDSIDGLGSIPFGVQVRYFLWSRCCVEGRRVGMRLRLVDEDALSFLVKDKSNIHMVSRVMFDFMYVGEAPIICV